MKSRFTNMTTQPKISEAILIAEKFLDDNSPMIIEISKKDDFKYNSGTGLSVATNLVMERPLVKVFTYKPWNRFSSVLGYSDSKSIHVNIRKLPSLTIEEVASNLIHEYCHHAGYNHSSNYKTEDKVKFSVPYWCSSWVEEYLAKNEEGMFK